MATRFIDKEYGTNSTTAIANDTTGTRKVRNLNDAIGIVYDSVDNTLKFNKNDAIVNVLDSTPSPTISAASTSFALDIQPTLAATAGNDTLAWLGGERIYLQGANLSKTGNATVGLHSIYGITGTNAGTFPKAAVLGEFHAGTTTADAVFVAMGGDGASARAMYGVATLNEDINQTKYGLDLSTNSYSGLGKNVGYTQADILMSNDVAIIVGGSSAPTDGAAGTGAQFAGPGSLFIMTGGTIKLYMNTNTKASPTWTAQT